MTIAFYTAHGVDCLGWPRGTACALRLALAATLVSAWVLENFGFATLRRNQASPMFVFIFTIVASEFIAYLAMLAVRHLAEDDLPAVVLARDAGRRDRGECLGRAGCARDARRRGGAVAVSALYATRPVHGGGRRQSRLAEFYGIDRRAVYMLTMLIAAPWSRPACSSTARARRFSR